jgi:hypothetical protein
LHNPAAHERKKKEERSIIKNEKYDHYQEIGEREPPGEGWIERALVFFPSPLSFNVFLFVISMGDSISMARRVFSFFACASG